MNDDLKSCPFCGRNPTVALMTSGLTYVHCMGDGCPLRHIDFIFDKWQNRPIEDALYARIDELISQCDAAYAPYRDMVSVARAEVDEFSGRVAKLEATNAAYAAVLQDIAHGPVGYWNDAKHAPEAIRSMMRSADEVLFHFPQAEEK